MPKEKHLNNVAIGVFLLFAGLAHADDRFGCISDRSGVTICPPIFTAPSCVPPLMWNGMQCAPVPASCEIRIVYEADNPSTPLLQALSPACDDGADTALVAALAKRLGVKQ
jgi:hypothetical protein